MAFFNNFYDLAASTSYVTHTVGAFDANCSTGGGTFKWVPSIANASITNIPGMRIKPTNSTVGYWERVWEGPLNVAWFGCQNTTSIPNTFATLGVSQATLDSRYGLGFATTSDNYDTTAIRYALRMMQTLGNQGLIFEPKVYSLTRACDLPISIIGGKTGRGMFVIDGNGATIVKANTLQFNFFQRIPVAQTYNGTLYPTDQNAAENLYIDNAFTFMNFNAQGSGGIWQNSGYAFLYLGATYGSIIQNIFLRNFDIGIRMEFCMNATVTNIFVNNATSYSLRIKPGSWAGAATANASSNCCEVSHVRVVDTNNQIACISVENSDTSVIRNCIIEGLTGNPQCGILWDSLNSTVCPNGTIQDCHIETACSKGAVYIKPRSGTKIYVSNIYIQYAQNIVALEASSLTGQYPVVVIDRIPNWPSGTKFLNIGTGTKWQISDTIINAYLTTSSQIVTASSTASVASASGVSGVMTYVTTAPHSLVAGQRVAVTGLIGGTTGGTNPVIDCYNGPSLLITSVGSTTFTVAGSCTGATTNTGLNPGTAVGASLWDTATLNSSIPTSNRVNWTAPWGI
jgi:hypothetical protein